MKIANNTFIDYRDIMFCELKDHKTEITFVNGLEAVFNSEALYHGYQKYKAETDPITVSKKRMSIFVNDEKVL